MKQMFIKIADQGLAKQLADLGFQYVKENVCFAFIQTDELMSVLQKMYSTGAVCENKLRF